MRHKINNETTSNLTVQEAGNEWIQSCKTRGLSLHTIDCYTKALSSLTGANKGQIMGNLKHSDINKIMDDMREQGQGGSTIALRATIYKTFARWANNQGYSNINTDGIYIPKRRTPKITILKDSDIRNMVNGFDIETIEGLRDRAIVSLLADSGLRVSELVTLNRDSIPTEVSKNKMGRISVVGKGEKVATIYYSPQTHRYIEEYLSHRTDDNEALFASIRTTDKQWVRIGREAIYLMVRKIGEQAGVKGRVTPHTLRHYTAMRYMRKNINLKLVKDIMRHESLLTTQRYLQYESSDIEDVARGVMG